MSKISRGTSWKQHRLADRLELAGRPYSVDVVARRATGLKGWRMTVVFLPWDAGDTVEAELAVAATTADVNRTVRELAADEPRLRDLFGVGKPV